MSRLLRLPWRFGVSACFILAVQLASVHAPDLVAEALPQSAARQLEILKTQQGTEDPKAKLPPRLETTKDWNRRLQEMSASADPTQSENARQYIIGPEDVLDINVFEAQEMNREVRVSAGGEISLPLLGGIHAAGLTPRELELSLEGLLHEKYMKDPHVSVFVREMESHPVSVMGAVRKPGTFQIRSGKTLLEILSLAEGLADDAGEDAIILRGAAQKSMRTNFSEEAGDETTSPVEPRTEPSTRANAPNAGSYDTAGTADSPNVVQVNLKDLLDSTDRSNNPVVFPGDIVKVTRAGIVYVVGAVHRPGGFAMKANEKISVLQAIALSEGLSQTAAKSSAKIIRTNEQNGARSETPIDLGKIMSGKSADPMLEAKDIVFVPDSAAKITFSRGVEAAAQTLTGLLIFHW